MYNILCIIPARSGSKGLPDKNIKLFNGKPLLAWSILQAKQSKYHDNMRIIVSTDSDKYATIAKEYGAEVPFLRPSKISGDNSLDIDFIKYTKNKLNELYNYNPDIIIHLRPTTPIRDICVIDNCIRTFIENYDNYDSLRTISASKNSPFKMYTIEDKKLIPLFSKIDDICEPYNCCRQLLHVCYIHNGYLDIIKTSILKNNTITGERIYPYVITDDVIDIDTIEDFENSEEYIVKNKKE